MLAAPNDERVAITRRVDEKRRAPLFGPCMRSEGWTGENRGIQWLGL